MKFIFNHNHQSQKSQKYIYSICTHFQFLGCKFQHFSNSYMNDNKTFFERKLSQLSTIFFILKTILNFKSKEESQKAYLCDHEIIPFLFLINLFTDKICFIATKIPSFKYKWYAKSYHYTMKLFLSEILCMDDDIKYFYTNKGHINLIKLPTINHYLTKNNKLNFKQFNVVSYCSTEDPIEFFEYINIARKQPDTSFKLYYIDPPLVFSDSKTNKNTKNITFIPFKDQFQEILEDINIFLDLSIKSKENNRAKWYFHIIKNAIPIVTTFDSPASEFTINQYNGIININHSQKRITHSIDLFRKNKFIYEFFIKNAIEHSKVPFKKDQILPSALYTE